MIRTIWLCSGHLKYTVYGIYDSQRLTGSSTREVLEKSKDKTIYESILIVCGIIVYRAQRLIPFTYISTAAAVRILFIWGTSIGFRFTDSCFRRSLGLSRQSRVISNL